MRGVEAPFQLLVSVFTMILVVTIAYRVLTISTASQCNQKWRQSEQELASTISQVVMAEPPTTYVANLQLKCGEGVEHNFSIESAQGSLCARICGEYSSQCYVLRHVVANNKGEIIYDGSACLRGVTPYTYTFILSGKSVSCGSNGAFWNDGTALVAGPFEDRYLSVEASKVDESTVALCVNHR